MQVGTQQLGKPSGLLPILIGWQTRPRRRAHRNERISAVGSIFENHALIWAAIPCAMGLIVIKGLARHLENSEHKSKPQTPSRIKSVIRGAVDFALDDLLFIVLFLASDLASALIYRILSKTWFFFRPAKSTSSLALTTFKASTIAGLVFVVVTQSSTAMYLYGLAVFSVMYWLIGLKVGLKQEQAINPGSLGKIEVVSVSIVSYLAIVAGSELLWQIGGLDLWIWFYIFMKPILTLAFVFTMVLLLPFIRLLFRTIHDTTGTFR